MSVLWEYDPCNDSSQDPDEDIEMITEYMEKVRDEALEKLTTLERAALFNELNEFIVRFREERDLENARSQME